jgi:hypothetical protein
LGPQNVKNYYSNFFFSLSLSLKESKVTFMIKKEIKKKGGGIIAYYEGGPPTLMAKNDNSVIFKIWFGVRQITPYGQRSDSTISKDQIGSD